MKKKKFNITGVCYPHLHYMMDNSQKMREVMAMVEAGEYFIINRPRQYGKTTTLYFLNEQLSQLADYFPVRMNFQGIDKKWHQSDEAFAQMFFKQLADFLEFQLPDTVPFLEAEKERIVELDWWQETTFDNLIFRCTPAQHFSGRGLNDRANTLWSSWIIQSEHDNIFFSGDSGYGPHFKEIGDKYGPFDFAMMECGQYNELWPEIHMFPEETAQAGIDVQAKLIMPIHWGAFKLGMHPWTEPVERISKKADELGIEMIIPKIGEPIEFYNSSGIKSTWWQSNPQQ